jgi:hypothetical protein
MSDSRKARLRRQRQFRPCEPGFGVTWSDAAQYRIWDAQTGTWVKLRGRMTEKAVRRYCLLAPDRYQPYAVRPIFHATRLTPPENEDAPSPNGA